jgi:hypothetical protein
VAGLLHPLRRVDRLGSARGPGQLHQPGVRRQRRPRAARLRVLPDRQRRVRLRRRRLLGAGEPLNVDDGAFAVGPWSGGATPSVRR